MIRCSRSCRGGIAVAVATGVFLLPTTATADPGERLGLPSIDKAQRFNLAPASRDLRPGAVAAVSEGNPDFVTAASQASELDAHDLDADPTSQRVRVGGVLVRQAGPDEPRAEFSYRMLAPSRGAVSLRVEEAGAEASRYDVLVNGVVVKRRREAPEQRGTYGGQVGLVHYDVRVPEQALRRSRNGRFTLTFRNASRPGPGARIANVWVESSRAADSPSPYGGSVRDAAALTRRGGSAELRGDLFGRPYAISTSAARSAARSTSTSTAPEGNPRLGFAFSESAPFLTRPPTTARTPRASPTETHFFRGHRGRARCATAVIRGGFRYLMVFLDAPGTVDLSRLQLNFTADPGNPDLDSYPGAFLSTDETLNGLWYAGAYTTQMATIPSDTGRPYPATPGPVHNDVVVAAGEEFLVTAPSATAMLGRRQRRLQHRRLPHHRPQPASAQNALDWFAANPSPEGQVPGVYLPLSRTGSTSPGASTPPGGRQNY